MGFQQQNRRACPMKKTVSVETKCTFMTSIDVTISAPGLSGQRMYSGWNRSQTFLHPQILLDASAATHQQKQQQQSDVFTCPVCSRVITNRKNIARHRRKCEQKCHLQCEECGEQFYRRDYYQKHLWRAHLTQDSGPRRILDDVAGVVGEGSQSGWRHQQLEEVVEGDVDVGEVLQHYVAQASSVTSPQPPPPPDDR